MDRMIRILHSLGPVMPRPGLAEAGRAATGAGVGLILTSLMLGLLTHSTGVLAHPMLIAPFGASAFLIFVVPNSPMAQPWSSVVGNSVAALAAVAALHIGLPALPTAALAVLLAVLAMSVLRAMHPPGGAVALATVLAATPDHMPGLGYIALPVAAGTLLLVTIGIGWNQATGRKYPFRQPSPPAHGTTDPAPERRFVPKPEVLAATLTRLRLGSNLGVEDLARLIEAAEIAANATALGPLTAAQMMSRDLVAVVPETPLPDMAQRFRDHRFKTLPVIGHDGHYIGIVSQSALVGRADTDLTAQQLLDTHVKTLAPTAPLAEVIALLADGAQQAVPVVEHHRMLGLITRSDLIALLSAPQA